MKVPTGKTRSTPIFSKGPTSSSGIVPPTSSNTSANPQQLARLANRTKAAGGKTVAPENFSDLLRQIQSQPHHIEQKVKHMWQPAATLWDSWLFYLCFAALLISEWALRKWWGLI